MTPAVVDRVKTSKRPNQFNCGSLTRPDLSVGGHETAGIYYTCRWRYRCIVARGTRAAAGNAGRRPRQSQIGRGVRAPC